jgi:hypothetical protein
LLGLLVEIYFYVLSLTYALDHCSDVAFRWNVPSAVWFCCPWASAPPLAGNGGGGGALYAIDPGVPVYP